LPIAVTTTVASAGSKHVRCAEQKERYSTQHL
jgi:hypothetical protein